jgi:hypothetical protein
MSEIVHNVEDRRNGCVGSWVVEPLVYKDLTVEEHLGRTVIYSSHNRAEAGTITSWRGGIVFARYSGGDTSAGASAECLCLGIRSFVP